MANHILAPYWAVMHRRQQDYAFFKALQPPVVKIMDGGTPDYQWVYDNLPEATLVMREWAIDDNHNTVWQQTLSNPAATGKRVAQQMVARAVTLRLNPAKTRLMGPCNEPKVWEPNGINAAVQSAIAFVDECKLLGWKTVALNLSVGWPGNDGHDMPPHWDKYAALLPALKRTDAWLGLHEYWKINGVADGWGWLAGRALKCPWDVPILIGECGTSAAVGNSQGVPTAKQGWRANGMSADTYADQLVDYHNRMAVDSRIKGLCVFLCDFANPEWWSKDLEPAYPNVLQRKSRLNAPATTPTVPPTQPPPVVTPPTQPPPSTGSVAVRFPLDTFNATVLWAVPGGSFQRKKSTTGAGSYLAHEGIDLSAAGGTPVYACADGVVAHVGDYRKEFPNVASGGYGLYIRIRHKGFDTVYAHLSAQRVSIGQVVKLGAVIGNVGTTGNSTGNHLHWEVRLTKPDGTYDMVPGSIYNACVDPIIFFAGLQR
jgi:murein DD-endopeptidase MepM/ murein hydrolase activator NlpD